ncbi:unnamed protein product [Protopolystoma xenopodis]|uniref:Uncharacterized protein n=1 Tax=Protopolystoma xenopodis TaxID=117903 RepID=A0A448WJY0_9PLAT|nr:unnamed protein product [Protopolystoma xenopodis]
MGIRRIPVLITIGLISCGSIILFGDPTAREQALIQALGTSTTRDLTTELTHSPLDDGGGIIMIGLTTSGELCCLNTSGLTVPLTPAILTRQGLTLTLTMICASLSLNSTSCVIDLFSQFCVLVSSTVA